MTDNSNKKALFYSNIQPLHKDTHAAFGLKTLDKPLAFTDKTHVVPITIGELANTVANFPIVFIGEDRVPAAALGLTPDTNLFVDESGHWADNTYIPNHIRRYPFIMAKGNDNADELFFCFDEGAEHITAENPDTPLFAEGQLSETGKTAMKMCEEYEHQFRYTQDAMKKLEDYDIFCTKTVSYNVKGSEQKIQFVAIDEQKFSELNEQQVFSLKKDGLLNLIYAHLFSLANWNKLIGIANR